MECKRVLSRLSAFLDGEVPANLVREIEEHLTACPSCRECLEGMRRVGSLVDRQPIPPTPSELAARVMAEGRRREASRARLRFAPRGRWRPQWLFDLSVPMRLAACSAVLLAFLTGVLMSQEVFLSENPRPASSDAQYLDGLEWFSSIPPKSLGSAYLLLSTPEEDRS